MHAPEPHLTEAVKKGTEKRKAVALDLMQAMTSWRKGSALFDRSCMGAWFSVEACECLKYF